MRSIPRRHPHLSAEGIGYDEVFSRSHADLSDEEPDLFQLIRATTRVSQHEANPRLRDWLDRNRRPSGGTPDQVELQSRLDQLTSSRPRARPREAVTRKMVPRPGPLSPAGPGRDFDAMQALARRSLPWVTVMRTLARIRQPTRVSGPS